MNIWQRSWLYRIWVAGGLAAVLAISVSSALAAEPGDDGFITVSVIAVAVYVVGIVVLQALQIGEDKRDPSAMISQDEAELMSHLALRPVPPEHFKQAAQESANFAAS